MLEIQLRARRDRCLSGEGVVLDVEVRAETDAMLETPGLNNSRSRLKLVREGAQTLELSGADHARLHGLNPLQALGQKMHVRAGQVKTDRLELLKFVRPLAPGRWRASLSYRWGETEAQTAVSNEVVFTVEPGAVQTARFRWFAGADARGRLEGIWTSRDREVLRWFYQISSRHDPGAVLVASELRGMGDRALQAAPELAHLDEIAGSRFERCMVWLEAGRLGWAQVSSFGKMNEPALIEHGLEGEVRLAGPAWQMAKGGLQAVVIDAQSAVAVTIDAAGAGRQRRWPLPGGATRQAVVVWDAGKGSGSLYSSMGGRVLRTELATGAQAVVAEAPGEVVALVEDQSADSAWVIGLWRDGTRLTVRQFDGRQPGENQAPAAVLTADPEWFTSAPIDSAMGASGLGTLWRGESTWHVVDGVTRHVLPARTVEARLVATRRALFVMELAASIEVRPMQEDSHHHHH